ncbi:DUF6789 family protein [Halegenticoccus tardaugens]|uniref:DUF6789 family protein n=1 Tax=Halegenticoccus tardaugens TaxID=2071624 RepID=UPI00100C3060|nr:DUF6789 family protein [Halegenticoccus tardaugens]
MNRPLSAIAGGVAGISVMSVLLLLLEVETREAIGLFEAVARFVGMPGNQFLGVIIFLVAGAVAWPLLFLALEDYLPGGPDPATRGMAFASVLWIAFVIAGRGDIGGPLFVVYAGLTLVAHLAYGFTLGAVYARLSSESDFRNDRAEPAEAHR